MSKKSKVVEDEVDMDLEPAPKKAEPAPGADGQVKGDPLPTNVPAGVGQLKEASGDEAHSEKFVMADNVNHDHVLYRKGTPAPLEHLAHFKKLGVLTRA